MPRSKRVSRMASLGWGLWMAAACGGSDAPPPPDAPVTQPGAVRLVAGDASLVSASGCNTRGGEGALVCALVVGTASGARGLWLLDVEAAEQGPAPVACDGSDGRCRLVTSSWSARATGQGFAGDTLLYQDATGAWALRRGETAPLLLVPGPVDHCLVDPLGRAAACFGSARAKGNDRVADLFAGALPTAVDASSGTPTPPSAALGLVDTTPVAVLGNNTSQKLYPPEVTLAPDGATILWSAVDATAPEAGQVLHRLALPVATPPAPVVVSAHVDSWQLSADGKALSWIEVTGTSSSAGRLVAAAFPEGTPAVLGENVGAAASFGARGLAFLGQSNGSSGALFRIADLLSPAADAVSSGVLRPLAVSAAGDLAYATSSTYDNDSSLDLYNVALTRSDGSSCSPLGRAGAEPNVFFVSAGRGLLWFQPDKGGGATDSVWFADTATCTPAQLSDGIWIAKEVDGVGLGLWAPATTSSQSTVSEGTLRLAALPPASTDAGAVDVQTRADQLFVSLAPRQARLGYSVHADQRDKKPERGQDGFWVSASFGSPP